MPGDGTTTVKSYITLTDSVINIGAPAGHFAISINSNTNWSVKGIAPWLLANKLTGTGNDSLKFTYTNYTDAKGRSDTIQIESTSIVKRLIISQSIPLSISNYRGILGNDGAKIVDSVCLRFNKPVVSVTIKSNNQFCLCDINSTNTDNGYGVRFSYACAALGGSYPFTITAKDAQGNSLTQDIMVNFYKSGLVIPGYITDYVTVNNETEAIIASYNPARITRYSLTQQKILQTFDLSGQIAPTQISFNPYNGKVYIVGTDPATVQPNAYPSLPDIYALDLGSGKVTKELTIQTDPAATIQAVPFKLGFTKSGLGIVLLTSMEPRLIDCTNGYKITVYPAYATGYYFDNVQANYDQTKLIMTQTYVGSIDYGIFDGTTNTISMFLSRQQSTRSVFITPNKQNGQIYFGQLYDQFIEDLQGNISTISSLDNRSNGTADFSYHKNEKNIIYFCDDNYMQMLDYNNSTTLMYCELINGIRKFNSTTDGNLTTAYKINSNVSSTFYIFDVNAFYRHISN